MKVIFTKEGNFSSNGIQFTTDGEYEVSDKIATYLTSTFPNWFKADKQAPTKVEKEPEPVVEKKEVKKQETVKKDK